MTNLNVGPGLAPPADWDNDTRRIVTKGRVFVAGGVLVVGGLIGNALIGNDDGGDSRTSSTTTTTISPELAADVAAACGSFDLAANRADTVYAERHSLFPSLGNAEGLIPKNEAVEALRTQVGNDVRVAGVVSEVYNLRDGRRAPNTLTVQGIQQAVDALLGSGEHAAEKTEYICHEFEFIEPDEDFAVVGGNATQIMFERGEDGVTRVLLETMVEDRVLRGYVLGANLDNADLDQDAKDFLEQFKNDVIITDSGTIVVRNLALNGSFEISDQQEQTPVTPTPEDDEVPAGGRGTTPTTATGGGSGGTDAEHNGDSDCGEGCGRNDCPTCNGGGNGGGSTTTTAPASTTTTTAAPTTTTTRPPTTVPPTTAPPTTTPETTTTTQPPRFTATFCRLDARRPDGGFGIVQTRTNLTQAELDALRNDPMNKFNFQWVDQSKGYCK